MIYLKILFILLIIIIGVFFGISNQQMTSIHFYGYITREMPLYLILYLSFIMGSIIAIINGTISKREMDAKEKSGNQKVKELEELVRKAQKQDNSKKKNEGIDGSGDIKQQHTQ